MDLPTMHLAGLDVPVASSTPSLSGPDRPGIVRQAGWPSSDSTTSSSLQTPSMPEPREMLAPTSRPITS